MAITEKQRHRMYTEFVKFLGEETTQAMLSHFPARDADQPVSRDQVDVLLARMEARVVDRLTNRMLTVAGIGLAAITALLAAFT